MSERAYLALSMRATANWPFGILRHYADNRAKRGGGEFRCCAERFI
jgi:hypothetical protein